MWIRYPQNLEEPSNLGGYYKENRKQCNSFVIHSLGLEIKTYWVQIFLAVREYKVKEWVFGRENRYGRTGAKYIHKQGGRVISGNIVLQKWTNKDLKSIRSQVWKFTCLVTRRNS